MHCQNAFSTRRSEKGLFCSRSCACKHGNANKTFGCNRSKLETWLEKELIALYGNIFKFNDRSLGFELDIVCTQAQIAFELNGIFHYEPVFGKDRLDSIQNKDKYKMQICAQNGLELCVIDTSAQKYFKPKGSEKYLCIITNLLATKKVFPNSTNVEVD